jgi:hypothetical protein
MRQALLEVSMSSITGIDHGNGVVAVSQSGSHLAGRAEALGLVSVADDH